MELSRRIISPRRGATALTPSAFPRFYYTNRTSPPSKGKIASFIKDNSDMSVTVITSVIVNLYYLRQEEARVKFHMLASLPLP